MKSVKKALTKNLPRYNLRSNPINSTSAKTSTSKVKVNKNIQVDVSDEEDRISRTLFTELPCCTSPINTASPEFSTRVSEEKVSLTTRPGSPIGHVH